MLQLIIKIGKGNITYSNGIDSDMTKPSYWKELLNEQNKQLLNVDEIQNLNTQITGKNNVNLESKAILVVTQDRIVLEPSITEPEVSEVELPMGTVLELVPENKIPTNFAERGPWYNYVVYLPITNENGETELKYALIPVHYNVSVGYLTLTPENIIDIALRCSGDSYELMNNTTFITSVYKCFGMELSLDSNINDKKIDVSTLELATKRERMKNIPVGSILQIENEYAIYLGTQNGDFYMISSMNGKVNSIVLSEVELENLTSIIDFTQNVENDDEKETEQDRQYEIIEGKEQQIQEIQKETLKNPRTGDNIEIFISVMIISLIGVVGTLKFKKQ